MRRLVMLNVLALSLLFPFACSTINYNLLVYDQPSPITLNMSRRTTETTSSRWRFPGEEAAQRSFPPQL